MGWPRRLRQQPKRCLCIRTMLSRIASPATTLLALVDLLNDTDRVARAHAAKAIGLIGSHASIPLLRQKTLAGEPDVAVKGECFRGVLANNICSGVELVSRFISADPDIAIEAATPKSECRDERAAQALIAFCTQCPADLLHAFYVSLSLS